MLRGIASVVVGYLAMTVTVFVCFTVAYFSMGTERAFRPASFDVSTLWVVIGVGVNVIAALVGGVVAASIARTSTPPKVLAILVLVFGLLLALPVMFSSETAPTARSGELSNFEAMGSARSPVWFVLVTPLIGAAGVMLGAGLVARRRT